MTFVRIFRGRGEREVQESKMIDFGGVLTLKYQIKLSEYRGHRPNFAGLWLSAAFNSQNGS